MKLNLGCGGIYKKYYVNIDAFENPIADIIMSADDLKFEDNSIEEILASQVIEHLGILGNKYALNECYRVLKPGCHIIIETPDIEKSFKNYLKGTHSDRKMLLTWIYGIESEGMKHKFCFPPQLLEEQLIKIGFENIENTFLEYERNEPILRIKCNKPKNCKKSFLICKYRKELFKQELIKLEDNIIEFEKDNLIQNLFSKIERLNKNSYVRIFNELTIEGGIHCPEITQALMNIIVESESIKLNKILNNLEIIERLREINFPNILKYALKETPGYIGEQKNLVNFIHNFGEVVIKSLLNPIKQDKIIQRLIKTQKRLKDDISYNFFSENVLIHESNELFQEGIKEFGLGNYEMAIRKFCYSIQLHRNQILSYWNLGRLYKLKGNLKSSKENYKISLKLTNLLESEYKHLILNKLDREYKYNKILDTPISSINELF